MLPADTPASVVTFINNARVLARDEWLRTTSRNFDAGTHLFWQIAAFFDPSQKAMLAHEADVTQSLHALLEYFFQDEVMRDLALQELREYQDTSFNYPNGMRHWQIWEFWTSRVQYQPLLSNVVLTLLCSPVGAAEVERSFSDCKTYGLNKRKSNMTPETIQSAHFIYCNRGRPFIRSYTDAIVLNQPHNDNDE